MNTDQSLLEFSVFYPEVGFSKSEPLFFWPISDMARRRKMTMLGNSKSRDEKWLKISILIHLQLVVAATDLVLMVQVLV